MNTHPCFNAEARHKYARVHLPIARGCNIQCRFCNRKYSCVNESRPGVSNAVISPVQALDYFNSISKIIPDISVAGIAGPGDAFAAPELTLETLRLIRSNYPEMLFCIATNGLNIIPYIPELKYYGATHITITINAVDPSIGERVYAWVRDGDEIHRGYEAARLLSLRQRKAVERLKQAGFTVKVNCILIPGVNDTHIEDVAQEAGRLGADIFNCMPLIPVEGTEFENLAQPSPKLVFDIRQKCAQYIKQMYHCQRCRADAAGLLHENRNAQIKEILARISAKTQEPVNKPVGLVTP